MNATYLAYGAEASLSMADANLEGVKTYDPNRITAPNQIVTVGVCVVAATSLLTGLFAMYIEASVIACLAFVFPLITGPMVISQRRKIQWIPSKLQCTSCTRTYSRTCTCTRHTHYFLFFSLSRRMQQDAIKCQ
jgi:hypothetical protein